MKQRNSLRHEKLRTILREARLKAGLKQEELGKRLKRGDSFISDVELGHRMLDVLEFVQYAEALGADPKKLFAKLI